MGTGSYKISEKLLISLIGLFPIGGVGRKSPAMIILVFYTVLSYCTVNNGYKIIEFVAFIKSRIYIGT